MPARATRIRPFATLGASLLARSGPRRAPLILAGADEPLHEPVPLPEVLAQIDRIEQAFAAPAAPAAPVAAAATETAKARVAFTLRLDRERHGALRRAVLIEGRSGQAIVSAALDRYLESTSNRAEAPANCPCPASPKTGTPS